MALFRTNSDQSMKLSSTATSDTSNDSERHPSIETRVCLIDDANKDENLKKNLKVCWMINDFDYLQKF